MSYSYQQLSTSLFRYVAPLQAVIFARAEFAQALSELGWQSSNIQE